MRAVHVTLRPHAPVLLAALVVSLLAGCAVQDGGGRYSFTLIIPGPPVLAGAVIATDTAVIAGDLRVSGGELIRAPGSVVQGRVVEEPTPAAVLGEAALLAIGLVPVAGVLAAPLSGVVAIGAVALTGFGLRRYTPSDDALGGPATGS
jgi:hypothetical protein